jgi:hypothetical protein
MSSQVFRPPWDLGPMKSSLKLPCLGKVDECCLHTGVDVSSLHLLICGLKLDDNLASFVIEKLLELVHGIQELLHGLHELRIDWDTSNKGPESCHLGQDA